jgi:hypothetical protein
MIKKNKQPDKKKKKTKLLTYWLMSTIAMSSLAVNSLNASSICLTVVSVAHNGINSKGYSNTN